MLKRRIAAGGREKLPRSARSGIFTGGPAADFVVKRFRPSGSEDFILRRIEIRSFAERTKSGMRRTKSCRSGRDKSAAYRGGWKGGKATPLREERDFTGGPAADFVVKRFRPSGSEDFIFCCREETKSVPLRNGRNPACAGRNPAVPAGINPPLVAAGGREKLPRSAGAGFHRWFCRRFRRETISSERGARISFFAAEKKRNPFLAGTDEIRHAPDEILPFGRVKSAACRGGW